MKVMFLPSESNNNRYLASLSKGLERQGVTVVSDAWHTLLPVLQPGISESPDVIHIHWLDTFIIGPTWPRTVLKGLRTPVELLIARLLGINIVWTIHNLTAHEKRYPRWDLFWRSLVARWCCDHLIVHCDSARSSVQERYRLGRSTPVTVIPHGHYLNAYPDTVSESDARQKIGVERDETVFVYFGQIRSYKQVPHLIDAFCTMSPQNSKLVIAGNPRSDSLRQAIVERSSNRDDVLTRLEFIPDHEVERYFKAADIVVLPYREILTSGSAILAMSFARAVIAPRMGCLPELITDGVNGFLYDPSESNGLEQTMKRTFDTNLEKMGKKGYVTVSQRDWDSIAERTQRVYTA